MKSLTYGILPTAEEFRLAFERECPDGKYAITLGRSDSKALMAFRLCDGAFHYWDLWDAINEVVNVHELGPEELKDVPHEAEGMDETRMSLVSGILQTLGFEWI